jgi:hypothetical protein
MTIDTITKRKGINRAEGSVSLVTSLCGAHSPLADERHE